MATKEQSIPLATPPHMPLTSDEADALRGRFSAELANVVPAKVESGSIVGVTNVRQQPGKKKPSKTRKKKGAAKTTKKKGARKSTKKTSKKTSKKR